MGEAQRVQLDIGSDGTDWSGAFICRKDANGRAEILVLEYTDVARGGTKTIRIAGGGCSGDENPWDSLGNEITQELGLELIDPTQVTHAWTNQKVPGKHHQHFFVTPFSNLQGELRTEDTKDPIPKDESDKDYELLGAPYWMTVEEAMRCLFYHHRQGLDHSLEIIKYVAE